MFLSPHSGDHDGIIQFTFPSAVGAPAVQPAAGPEIVQLAYFVPDIKQAALRWAKRLGAGPFFIAERIPLDAVRLDGAPAALDHSSAYGWWGRLMVELVQQNGDDPSVFSDRPWGLHHAAYFAPQLPAELARLEARGFPVRMTARAGQVRFAFADANPSLGHYLEIYEDEPGLRRFYAMVEAASQDWDGSEPLRSLG